ncbi:MAG: methyltransferase domain-containing protein [Pseudomonadota bacterium]
MIVFDRDLVRAHRARAAPAIEGHDFLHRHVASGIIDRLDDILRDFTMVIDLGTHGGVLADLLTKRPATKAVVRCDLSPEMVARAPTSEPVVAADEEMLPFGAATVDLIVSAMALHWTNDLPGALVQINQTLRPDGLFLGALLGGSSLTELRIALTEAEIEVSGGANPRLSPLTDIRDLGGLLQRAGFALPVIDRETVTVTYDNVFRMITDLRGMGETNAAINRSRKIPPRAFWPRVAEIYHDRFAEDDGRIPATFEVIYASGWAPAANQQQPLRPGSAKSRLADALGTTEKQAGESVPQPPSTSGSR